jgi:hypothetical protein
MEIVLYVIILALAVNLMANMIWKYLPYMDKRADVWGTIIIIIVCVLIVISRKETTNVSGGQQSPPSQDRLYEIKKYNDIPWEKLISDANYEIVATAVFLTKFDRPQMIELIKKIKKDEKFKVNLFVLKPNGRSMEARIKDEYPPPYPSEIAGKLLTFRELFKGLSDNERERMSVKYYDVYPTVAVIIIDDDLYTYPYIAGHSGVNATVTIFKAYKSNPQTKALTDYFKNHLEYIESKAQVIKKEDYEAYEKMVSR